MTRPIILAALLLGACASQPELTFQQKVDAKIASWYAACAEQGITAEPGLRACLNRVADAESARHDEVALGPIQPLAPVLPPVTFVTTHSGPRGPVFIVGP